MNINKRALSLLSAQLILAIALAAIAINGGGLLFSNATCFNPWDNMMGSVLGGIWTISITIAMAIGYWSGKKPKSQAFIFGFLEMLVIMPYFFTEFFLNPPCLDTLTDFQRVLMIVFGDLIKFTIIYFILTTYWGCSKNKKGVVSLIALPLIIEIIVYALLWRMTLG